MIQENYKERKLVELVQITTKAIVSFDIPNDDVS